jgi:hypothetical protein
MQLFKTATTNERPFRVKRNHPKILRNRKKRIQRRLAPKHGAEQARPMFKGRNLRYEMAERVQAMSCGGIGALHLMVQRLGLVEDIDGSLKLLKVHLPYHESDHVLNIAYNILAGGGCAWKTSNNGARTKTFSTGWTRSGFRTRRRREISRVDLRKGIF